MTGSKFAPLAAHSTRKRELVQEDQMALKEIFPLFHQNLWRQTKTDTLLMARLSSLLEKTEIDGQMTNPPEIRPKGKA